jgi:hypothetical protein
MVDWRGSLCHRCGSPDIAQVDESHHRCTECGEESRFTHVTAVVNDSPSPAQRAAAEDRLRSFAASTERAFAGASFFPYGLDDRWTGLRRFGGHGGSHDHASHLTLAFGDDPSDAQAAEVRVETELPRRHYGETTLAARDSAFRLARHQVEHLWRHTGVLRDDVRRAAFPVDGDRRHDPTVAWDRAAIPVDGAAVEFRVLSSAEHWVAQAIIDPLVVGISSYRWPIEAVGLRSETTFEVYAEGLAELQRRRR